MRKKKAMAAALGINLAVCVLAGCEKTPEESIVKEKGADSIRQYESTEETKGGLWERLNAPKHYKNESVYENGGLVIDTDAQVLDENNQPIPHLYAAGDVISGFEGAAHQSGDCLTVVLFYGKVAGQKAALRQGGHPG